MIGEFLIARHLAGELKSRGKIGFRESGVILHNHFLRIACGKRPQNNGDENAGSPDHGFAMANFRMDLDSLVHNSEHAPRPPAMQVKGAAKRRGALDDRLQCAGFRRN